MPAHFAPRFAVVSNLHSFKLSPPPSLPPAPQNLKTNAAAAPEKPNFPEPIFWVKCDECDRWRIINGLSYEEQVKLQKKSWFCRMHPDVSQRECDKVVNVSARARARGCGGV